MESAAGVEADRLAEQFGLHSLEDYDTNYPLHAWKVGIKSDFPGLLKRRLVASVIATQMGNSSVDRTLKKYLPIDLEEGEVTKGQIANDFIVRSHTQIHSVVDKLTEHADGSVGRIMAELTMMRQQYTATCFLFMANRGAIFEGYSLLRMQLEQFAWIIAVDRNSNPEDVKRVRAQSSLKHLDRIVPKTSRLYGQLSAHAHWSYDAHVRAISSKEGKLGVLFASASHKAELLYHGVFFVGLFAKLVLSLRSEEIKGQASLGAQSIADLDHIYSQAVVLAKEIKDFLRDSIHD